MRDDGYYAIYKGREYSLGFQSKRHGDREYILTSRNEKDADRGFIKDKRGIYSKIVKPEELETVFGIQRWCKYKGHEFQILVHMKESDTYEIVYVNIGDPIPVKELGFTFAERGVYKKTVKREELDSVYEVKRVFSDF